MRATLGTQFPNMNLSKKVKIYLDSNNTDPQLLQYQVNLNTSIQIQVMNKYTINSLLHLTNTN